MQKQGDKSTGSCFLVLISLAWRGVSQNGKLVWLGNLPRIQLASTPSPTGLAHEPTFFFVRSLFVLSLLFTNIQEGKGLSTTRLSRFPPLVLQPVSLSVCPGSCLFTASTCDSLVPSLPPIFSALFTRSRVLSLSVWGSERGF